MHTRTYSELFLCPIHVPRMFDMHLLRALPASLRSSYLPLSLSVLSCCLAINLANEKTPGKRDKFSDLVTKRRQKKNNTKKIQIALNVKSIWMPKTFHPPLSHSTLPSAALSHTVSVASL